MSKVTPGAGSNQQIYDAIRKIAFHGIINPQTKSTYTAGQFVGYVVAIHGEEADEYLRGTIDVKEYGEGDALVHSGVYLSAIQNNPNGLIVIPKMYSDVLVTRNPSDQHEYVTMFSHVDVVQLDAHEEVVVEVKEREQFDPNDPDSPTVEDLQETGVYSQTTHTKNKIKSHVQSDDDNFAEVQMSPGSIKAQINNDSSVTLDANKIEAKRGNSSVTVEDGTVFLGSKSNTDDAVLGSVLVDTLDSILGYLIGATTITSLGPQPLANKIPDLMKMRITLANYKTGHTGFLTNKVQVQK